MQGSATVSAAVCADCGAPAHGNFCSSCGADLRPSSLGLFGQAVAPVRRSFPAVYLKLLRAPIRQTVAFAEDPSYRGYISFALAGIALYLLIIVPIVMAVVAPPRHQRQRKHADADEDAVAGRRLRRHGDDVPARLRDLLLVRHGAAAVPRLLQAVLHGARLRRPDLRGLRVRRAQRVRRHRHDEFRSADDRGRLAASVGDGLRRAEL